MSFLSDALVEKIRLKKSLIFWQTLCVIVMLLFLFLAGSVDVKRLFVFGEPYIARISINGFIDKDYERDKAIRDISNDKFAQGLLIHLDSPGGTLIGGETLYSAIKEVAATKKVAVVMGSMATSGAYMTAIAADYIIAHNGTITGSVGVIMQSPDLTDIMQTLGIKFHTIKSGKFKGIPSMFEHLSDEGKDSLTSSIDDAYQYFIDLVLLERKITDVKVIDDISTGKVYTARQALDIALIDHIGNEADAINWFNTNNVKGKVKDINLYQSRGIKKFQRLSIIFSDVILKGIKTLWQDSSSYGIIA